MTQNAQGGEYALEILDGFNGTIQADACGGYSHLTTSDLIGGDPLKPAFCCAQGAFPRHFSRCVGITK